MARNTAPAGLVWLALYAWLLCAVVGFLLLLGGSLYVEESWNVVMIVGAVILFVLAPLLSLARFVMPRSWKRSLNRRGTRRF